MAHVSAGVKVDESPKIDSVSIIPTSVSHSRSRVPVGVSVMNPHSLARAPNTNNNNHNNIDPPSALISIDERHRVGHHSPSSRDHKSIVGVEHKRSAPSSPAVGVRPQRLTVPPPANSAGAAGAAGASNSAADDGLMSTVVRLGAVAGLPPPPRPIRPGSGQRSSGYSSNTLIRTGQSVRRRFSALRLGETAGVGIGPPPAWTQNLDIDDDDDEDTTGTAPSSPVMARAGSMIGVAPAPGTFGPSHLARKRGSVSIPAIRVRSVMSPYTLIFTDNLMETAYRTEHRDSLGAVSCRTSLYASWLAGLIVIFLHLLQQYASLPDGTNSGSITDTAFGAAYLHRYVLISCTMAVMLVPWACMSFAEWWKTEDALYAQITLASALALGGATWTVASVYGQAYLYGVGMAGVNLTSAGMAMCFLMIVHSCGRMLLYPFLVLISLVISGTFLIAAALSTLGSAYEPVESVILQIFFCVIGSIILCGFSYQFECLRRHAFSLRMSALFAHRQLEVKRKETLHLRDDIIQLTSERYDLDSVAAAAASNAADLTTPIEKAMLLLKEIQTDRRLNTNLFLDVKRVITLLANASDFFRPAIEEQIETKALKLDIETEKWILQLIQEGQGGGPIGGSGSAGAGADAPQIGTGALLAPSSAAGESAVSSAGADHKNAHQRENSQSGGGLHSVSAGGSGTATGTATGTGTATTSSGIAPVIHDEEEKHFRELISSTENWDYDVFDVFEFTKGRPLFFIGMALLTKYDLIRKFKIDLGKLHRFLTVIESGYRDKPYHNSVHAADVARTVHFFIMKGGLRSYVTDLEIFAALWSALIHDYDHPGKNNNFHIVTREHKAILYNDRSVLENHHCAQAWIQVLKEESNILTGLSSEQFLEFRKLSVEMVLATDLALHFDLLAKFKNLTVDQSKAAFRLEVLKMALKCADVGHTAKALPLHIKWSLRVQEEFFLQGDEEKRRGLPISPWMDRSTPNLPKSQTGFINFLCVPMFEAWTEFLKTTNSPGSPTSPTVPATTGTGAGTGTGGPTTTASDASGASGAVGTSAAVINVEETIPCLNRLMINRKHWMDEEKAASAAAAAVAATNAPVTATAATATSATAAPVSSAAPRNSIPISITFVPAASTSGALPGSVMLPVAASGSVSTRPTAIAVPRTVQLPPLRSASPKS